MKHELKARFSVTLHGMGGHGSRPDNAHNPVDCFAAVYGALKQAADELGGKLQVRSVDCPGKSNVIPDEMRFSGVFLAGGPEGYQPFLQRLDRTLDAICPAYLCRGERTEP